MEDGKEESSNAHGLATYLYLSYLIVLSHAQTGRKEQTCAQSSRSNQAINVRSLYTLLSYLIGLPQELWCLLDEPHSYN
eukprot:scaffold5042_cov81-Cylindrotheca_fusiformis.AAC.4